MVLRYLHGSAGKGSVIGDDKDAPRKQHVNNENKMRD